jgi:hypothetical protein
MRFLLWSCASLLFATTTAQAEPAGVLAPDQPAAPASPDRRAISAAYLTLGMGASDGRPAGFASASMEAGPLVVSVRAAGRWELNILGPTPSEEVNDYGVLVGAVARGAYVSFSATAGISRFQSVTRGKLLSDGGDCILVCSVRYEPINKAGVGIPFAATLTFHGAYAGGGLSLFGNLNDGASYVGLGLSFSGGLLR